jgi:AraC-like DNA-binding protein
MISHPSVVRMPSYSLNLLNNFPVIRTGDPSSAADRLTSGYGATHVHVTKASDAFNLVANNLQLSDLGLSYVATTGLVSATFPPSGTIRQVFSIEGEGLLSFAGEQQQIRSGLWSTVIPAGTGGTISFGPNYAQLAIRIEVKSLHRYLSALIGGEVTRAIIFETESISENPAMHALKSRVLQFATDYNARGIYFSSLANAEVQRMIIMKFLMCHRHSYTKLLLREPVPIASTTVRLVEEYIEANWHKPLDIEALTKVAGVSARSIFRQFSKERGQAPWEFVKSIRMRKALIMLENPGPSTSVTQVALKCGFQNTGHFAGAYKATFCELPSETLLRGMRK